MSHLHKTRRRLAGGLFLILPLAGCATAPASAPAPAPPPHDFVAPQMVAERVTAQDPNRVALGRLLFHDPRLSKSHHVSCNSCHVLRRFGMDGKVTSTVIGARVINRNVPSIFNAATHLAQFWDGRSLTVEAQAGEALTNPVEM